MFKDGASAVYGSDAIGGVINFITKSDYQGIEIGVRAGANDDGEFAKRSMNLSAGFGDFKTDGYNVLVSADFSQRDPTSVRDGSNDIQQDQYRAVNLRLNPLFSSFSNQTFFTKETAAGVFSQTNAAADVRNLTGCDPSRLITATGPAVTGLAAFYGVTTAPLLNRTFCNFDGDAYQDVQSKGEDVSFISRGTFRLGTSATAFVEAGYSKSDRLFRGAPRAISGLNRNNNFLLTGVAPSFQAILDIGHPDNPFNTLAVPARAAIGHRFEHIENKVDLTNTQMRGLAGVKGVLGTWDWEAAVLWNRSEREETSYGFYYLPVLRQLLGPPGPTSGRSIASISADPELSKPLTNLGVAEILQYDAKVATEFGALPGGPIGFAAGFELREETLKITPDPINAAGNVLGLSNQAIDATRDVKSAFFEFRAPILKDFEMDFAGRFDSYPGFKTNFVPKVGAKWTVFDGLALRSTYAEGFRAPALSQMAAGGAQFFNNNLDDPLRCEEDGITPKPGAEAADCAKSVAGISGGNPALKPETSKSYSFGMVYSPTSNIDVLVDWYKISKKGEVALDSVTTVLEHPERFPATAILRDPNPLTWLPGIPNSGPLLAVTIPWVNQGATTVSGIDLELKVRNSLGEWGKLSTTLRAGYQLTYLREESPGLPTYNVVGANGGLADWATSSDAIPRVKLRLASAWTMGAHQFNGAVNYVSSISHIRRYDGSAIPPEEYSGSTCHYGPTNPDGVGGRSVLGVAPTATNGRNFYTNYHPDCTTPAWTTYDIGYFYRGVKDLSVGLTVQNVLDTKAPYFPGQTTEGYHPGLHNNTGRYFTFSMDYKFK